METFLLFKENISQSSSPPLTTRAGWICAKIQLRSPKAVTPAQRWPVGQTAAATLFVQVMPPLLSPVVMFPIHTLPAPKTVGSRRHSPAWEALAAVAACAG